MRTKLRVILFLAIVTVSIGITGGELIVHEAGMQTIVFNGIPRIASMTLQPDVIKPEMGDITASVDVYNDGSTDTISVGIPSGNGFTSQTLGNNDIEMEKGGHNIFTFRIIPTTEVLTDTKYTVRAIATAQGSGIAVDMTKQFTLQPSSKQSSGFDVVLFIFTIATLLIIETKRR